MAAIGRELLRFIVLEVWAYWRKQWRERRYEADIAAFRTGKGNLSRQLTPISIPPIRLISVRRT